MLLSIANPFSSQAGPRLAEYCRSASGLLSNIQVILEGATGFDGVVEERVLALKEGVYVCYLSIFLSEEFSFLTL